MVIAAYTTQAINTWHENAHAQMLYNPHPSVNNAFKGTTNCCYCSIYEAILAHHNANHGLHKIPACVDCTY